MKSLKWVGLRLAGLGLLLTTAFEAQAVVVSIDPRATYLRTESDNALDAVPLSLSALGISPGNLILIERVGFYTPMYPGFPDSIRYLDAVFSGSAVLLPSSNLNRVQDAIDAGTDVSSPNTWLGNSPTDIPQDFAVDDGGTFSSVQIQVPAGAEYIYFTVNDSLFGDNADPNGDFGAAISIVPEPGGWSILGAFGVVSLANAAVKRRGARWLRRSLR